MESRSHPRVMRFSCLHVTLVSRNCRRKGLPPPNAVIPVTAINRTHSVCPEPPFLIATGPTLSVPTVSMNISTSPLQGCKLMSLTVLRGVPKPVVTSCNFQAGRGRLYWTYANGTSSISKPRKLSICSRSMQRKRGRLSVE